MAKEKRIGVYLGQSSIAAVVVEDKKIIASSKFDFTQEIERKKENVGEEVILESAINKVLRELFTDEKKVYLSLSDKDFIFRRLELPLLKRHEIELSISYQIQDYIPFKIEELTYTYNYNISKQNKKTDLSFIGIKTTNIEKFKELFSNLEKEVVTFEPASLSLFKVIKSMKKFSNIKNFVILDFIEKESYLTLFYQGLPLFNRYLSVSKKDNKIDFEKFNDSVSLSLQYAKREFNFYEIETFILITNETPQELLSFLKEELQKDIEVLTPFDITKISSVSVENIKALGVAEKDSYTYKFKSIEVRPKEPAIPKKVISEEPLNIALISILLIVGSIISLFLYLILENKIFFERAKIKKYEEEFVVPLEFKKASLEDLNKIFKEEKDKLNILEGLKVKIDIEDFFRKIAQFLPTGFSLENIELYLENNNRYTATIKGYCFLPDEEDIGAKLDEFIFQFKKDSYIQKIFKNIDLISTNKEQRDRFKITYFLIKFE